MTEARDAVWEACSKPKALLALWFTELGFGKLNSRTSFRILLASNGKIYRVSFPQMKSDEETWEGYSS